MTILFYQMHKDLECNVAYFSMDENNPRIKAILCRWCAAVYENGYEHHERHLEK